MVCGIRIILKSYETESMFLPHVTKEVRENGAERNNILKEKDYKKVIF